MAYQKPAVTVKQVQKTRSPIYPEPEFQSCVVGAGYYWQDPAREDDEMNSVYSEEYDGTELVVSGGNFTQHTNILTDTVVVDLMKVSKDASSDVSPGEVKHLVKDTDFTVTGSDITINANIQDFSNPGDSAEVKVGFLSERTDMVDQFEQIVEPQQIRDWIGEPVSWNPLAYGADLMLANSGAATNVIGTDASTPGSEDHSNAVSVLENKKDIYAIAPLTQVPAENEKYLTHVVDMSKPENKAERIVFTNREITSYATGPEPHTTSEKNDAAQAIQDYATSKGEKRFFNIHPDGAYVRENRHVSTLRQSFIQAAFGSSFDLLPRFISSRKIGGTRYKAFQKITSTEVDELIAAGIDYITVYAPVPGYYYNVAVAGQTVAKEPQAPLTNSGINGISKVYRSNDYFNEAQLNTIAEGGNWIIQELSSDALVNRHQLSTDATSVETRELSITTAVDYVAKYVRDLLSPVVGTRNITPSFIEEIRASINGAAETLVNNGRIKSLDVIDVYQDELQPDTVRIDLAVTPFYPVNYIKITLVI